MLKVLRPDTPLVSSLSLNTLQGRRPELKIVREIPKNLIPKIEEAIRLFVLESGVKGDPAGVFNQTIESIANATFLKGNGDFWLAEDEEGVAAYLLAHVTKDIDNRLTYWVGQSWVRKDYRGNPLVKDWWEDVRKEAKRKFCSHLVIVSSRNPRAYERFLGHGMEEYASLLMENLDGTTV